MTQRRLDGVNLCLLIDKLIIPPTVTLKAQCLLSICFDLLCRQCCYFLCVTTKFYILPRGLNFYFHLDADVGHVMYCRVALHFHEFSM